MRLSEERVRHISRRMAEKLVDSGAVNASRGAGNLATLIAQTILNDLRAEEEIDSEVRSLLLRQRHLPPEGSGEYEALFLKTKREVAQRRGWPL